MITMQTVNEIDRPCKSPVCCLGSIKRKLLSARLAIVHIFQVARHPITIESAT